MKQYHSLKFVSLHVTVMTPKFKSYDADKTDSFSLADECGNNVLIHAHDVHIRPPLRVHICRGVSTFVVFINARWCSSLKSVIVCKEKQQRPKSFRAIITDVTLFNAYCYCASLSLPNTIVYAL